VKSAYRHGRYDVCYDHVPRWRVKSIKLEVLPEPTSWFKLIFGSKVRCCGERAACLKEVKNEALVCDGCGRERKRVTKRILAHCIICKKTEPLTRWELMEMSSVPTISRP